MALVAVFALLPRFVAEPVVTTGDRAQGGASPAPVDPPKASPSPALAPSTVPARRPPVAKEAAPSKSLPSDEAWNAAVTEALQALDRGDLTQARDALVRAEAARPGSSAVADARRRLEDALRSASLAEHRRRGEEAEAKEDWPRARAEYEAALKLDPTVAFALDGRARAVMRSQLDERLEGYLRRPDRLSTDAVAREAEVALDRASEVDPAGPRLRQQIAAVRQALLSARTPVTVRLLSDGLTDVTVLRVGRLGAFKEKALELRPGSYVVVGTRRGYRDARLTLEVPPGRSPEPLLVRCGETL